LKFYNKMKYLKKYESFDSNLILDIKDILIELEDLDFNIEYTRNTDNLDKLAGSIPIMNIFIRKNNNDFFYMDENVKYTLKRLANYLNIDLYGYFSDGKPATKFYIYRDNRDIRTQTIKMDEKWPRIHSLRIIIPEY